MITEEQISGIVYQALEKVDPQLLKGRDEAGFKDVSVFGHLDSLKMVTFVVAVEEALRKQLGKAVFLLGARGGSAEPHPFQTAGTLIKYIARIIEASS